MTTLDKAHFFETVVRIAHAPLDAITSRKSSRITKLVSGAAIAILSVLSLGL